MKAIIILLSFFIPAALEAQDTIFYKKMRNFESLVLSEGKHYNFFLISQSKTDTVAKYRYAKYENITIEDIFITEKQYIIVYRGVDLLYCTVYLHENSKWSPGFAQILKSIEYLEYPITCKIASVDKIILSEKDEKTNFKIDYDKKQINRIQKSHD